MGYPDDVIAAPDYIDKGVTISLASCSLNEDGDYRSCVLPYRARGRVIQDDGTVFASNISVRRGGDIFTEVFSLPVPAGKYFFHQEDVPTQTSKLYFHAAQTDSVAVAFDTRGSIIKAPDLNAIQSDLRAVELLLGGTSGIKAMYAGTLDFASSPWIVSVPYAGTVTSIIPLAITNSGASLTTSINLTAPRTVTFTPSAGPANLYYLILVL